MFSPRRLTLCLLIAVASATFMSPAAPCWGQDGEVLLSYHRDEPAQPSEPPNAASDAADPVNPLRVDRSVWPAAHVAAQQSTALAEPSAVAAPTTHAMPIAEPPVANETTAAAQPIPQFPPTSPSTTSHGTASLASFTSEAASASGAEDDDFRRLAPRAASAVLSSNGDVGAAAKKPKLPFSFPAAESLTTALGGLAAVVALFLVCAWLFRRTGPQQPGVLPSEAFALLGVAPLAGRNVAHLIRLGNKLVLLAIAPDGVQTLAEVTDPAEVDRLSGLCVAGGLHGPTAEFQQVLAQLAKEPARGFLGRETARR